MVLQTTTNPPSLIIGGPGCGKTTRLLNIMEEHLKECEPTELAFLAFTKKAADEARYRASLRFGYAEEDLIFFRTIHSLAFMQITGSRGAVMEDADYRQLANLLHMRLKLTDSITPASSRTEDATIVFLEQLSRVKDVSLEFLCRKYFVRWPRAKLYQQTLEKYKRVNGKIDFTDMLVEYRDEFVPIRLRALFIDEAQDLSPLHWELVKLLVPYADNVYFAGDDDQAIFRWAGADVQEFLSIKGNKEVLPISHRLPNSGWRLADTIARQIRNRYAKDWRGREEEGFVKRIADCEQIEPMEGSWLYLARHQHQLSSFTKVLRRQGHPYTLNNTVSNGGKIYKAAALLMNMQEGGFCSLDELQLISECAWSPFLRGEFDKDKKFSYQDYVTFGGMDDEWFNAINMSTEDYRYMQALLNNGYDIDQLPVIRVSTIHGVKGGEADYTVLMTDVSSETFNAYTNRRNGYDDERRVLYVGVSRHRKGLFIPYPETSRNYSLPSPRALAIQ